MPEFGMGQNITLALLLALSLFIASCSPQEISNIVSSLKKETVTVTGISGEIIDSKTKMPLKDVTINIEGRSTTTDANGTYKVELPVGIYKIIATKSGYDRISRTVEIKGKSVEDFSLVAEQKPSPAPSSPVIAPSISVVPPLVSPSPSSSATPVLQNTDNITSKISIYEVSLIATQLGGTTSQIIKFPVQGPLRLLSGAKLLGINLRAKYNKPVAMA